MRYMNEEEQKIVNVFRVVSLNSVIGSEFSRMIHNIGYDQAVDLMQKIARQARSKDFVQGD